MPHFTPLSVLVICVMGLLWFFNLGERQLNRPDEGRYTELGREMYESGDYITPKLNGLKYFEKPPLQYWATAGFFHLPLALETKARLWTALTGFATLLAVFAFVRSYQNHDVGFIAMVILGSMLWFYAMGHINTLDMGLSTFLCSALLSFINIFRTTASPQQQKIWACALWISMALAFLSKGLVGLLIPAATLFLYCLFTGQWRLLTRLHWGKGLSLLLLICLPWMILAHLRNPEFFDFFIIHEHFTRFLDTSHKREGAWYYFLPILLVGLMPWTLYLVQLQKMKTSELANELNIKWLLLIWCGFIFFFFSISKSKLPSYILPMFPALAILLSLTVIKTSRNAWRFGLLLPIGVGLTFIAYPLLVPKLATEFYPASVIAPLAKGVVLAGIVLLLVSLFAYFASQRVYAVLALGLGFIVALHAVFSEYHKLHPQFSGYEASEKMRAEMGKQLHTAKLYSLLTYDQTLAPYLGRTMTLVEYTDEFALGQKAAPERYIPRLEGFFGVWLTPEQQYAIADPRAIAVLDKVKVPYTLVFSNQRYSFIKRLNQ